MTKTDIKERLEYLRGELRKERISYDELHELQSLAAHIEPGDVELLEAAGVPENQKQGHTPGPWKANKWAPGWEVGAPDSRYTICSLAGYNNEQANARLIAAAPDLLAVCKQWAVFMQANYKPDEITWWHETLAALTKATGESQA